MDNIPGVSAIRYAFNEIAKNGTDRYWWRDRFIKRIVGPTQQRIYGYSNAIDPFDGEQRYTDWDVLVILDACRADLFEETIPDSNIKSSTYEVVESPGSSTPEWTSRLFEGRSFGDVVYITANPWAARIAPDSFYDRIDVWHSDFNDNIGTVPPEMVADAASAAQKKYPNKRIVVHFMQPHVPFIGSKKWRQESKQSADKILEGNVEDTGRGGEFGELRYGDLDRKSLWTDYKSTLELALVEVEKMQDELRGRIVITSDHGNMFGDWAWPFPIRVYGHPGGLRSSPLVKVPWAVIESNSTCPTVQDEGAKHVPLPGKKSQLSDKLEALGYK